MGDQRIALTKELSELFIDTWAPLEKELQGELLESYSSGRLFDRRRAKADDMGFGIGDVFAISSMLSPLLIIAAEWVAKEIIGKALADVSVAAIKKRLEKKPPAASPPLDKVLQLKLASDLLDHLSLRGKTLGVDEVRMRAVCEQVSFTLVPLLAAAIAQHPKAS
ncbi:hypothetical protein [Variovorax fucosicus]|uniref:hypothetical protein n=1 Tax=Variovorax fucosicus TaxID=3053517 RepID=UPI002574936E|nr:hypothetical protein [Variovorax sp. J22G47]MDM0059014.1 hypothetical protein [Variovorax sp. J22G47]